MTCPECGFEYGQVDPGGVAARLEPVAARFTHGLTTEAEPELRARPAPEAWSRLEYACHVRDVLLIQRDRLFLALVEDTPSFARMHRDERVVLDGYAQQDPARVAAQLATAAELVGDSFGRVPPDRWDRPLVYNWPEPRRMDVRWLAAHTVHEAVHHLADFEKT